MRQSQVDGAIAALPGRFGRFRRPEIRTCAAFSMPSVNRNTDKRGAYFFIGFASMTSSSSFHAVSDGLSAAKRAGRQQYRYQSNGVRQKKGDQVFPRKPLIVDRSFQMAELAPCLLVKSPHRCGGPVIIVPDTAADGQEIGARIDHLVAIIDRNAADGDARHGHHFLPPRQNICVSRGRDLLGRGWKEGAEGDVIRPGVPGFKSKFARRLAGNADDGVVANLSPGLRIGCVVLPDMNAVASQFCSKIGPVVHDESNIAILCHRAQNFRGPAKIVIGNPFKPELNAGDIPAIQRRRQCFGECFRTARAKSRR